MRYLVLIFLVCVGCGPLKANPCATPGSSYLEHVAEEAGGTCGALSDQVVNIASDGTIPAAAGVTCDSIEYNGCTTRKSNCKITNNGVTCTSNSVSTFSADGKSGAGTLSMICTNSTAGCSSTYDVALTRQ